MLDLDKARVARATKRADKASGEATGDGTPVIFGGREITVLPAELPFDVIRPLDKINDEIALLLGQALRMQSSGQAIDGARLVLDLFAANAALPKQLIDIVKAISTALLSADGLQAFLDEHPSINDIAALIGGIFDHYGASLGESLRSVESSASDGPKSEPTSSGSTDSTPEPYSAVPEIPADPSASSTSSTS